MYGCESVWHFNQTRDSVLMQISMHLCLCVHLYRVWPLKEGQKYGGSQSEYNRKREVTSCPVFSGHTSQNRGREELATEI